MAVVSSWLQIPVPAFLQSQSAWLCRNPRVLSPRSCRPGLCRENVNARVGKRGWTYMSPSWPASSSSPPWLLMSRAASLALNSSSPSFGAFFFFFFFMPRSAIHQISRKSSHVLWIAEIGDQRTKTTVIGNSGVVTRTLTIVLLLGLLLLLFHEPEVEAIVGSLGRGLGVGRS